MIGRFDDNVDQPVFTHGGIVVFSNANRTQMNAVDLVNQQIVRLTMTRDLKNIEGLATISRCGITLEEVYLKHYFGEDFVQQRDAMWDAWVAEHGFDD